MIDDATNSAARRRDAAEETLRLLGYRWAGGLLWKPPLGKAPKFSRLRDFLSVYRLYRKAAHSRRYCLQIAFGCAFRKLPF